MASVTDDDAVAMKPPSSDAAPATIPDETDHKDEAPHTASSSDPSNDAMNLGGEREQKSFALLDGVFQDPESEEKERVTIDITRLPALLGRSNESDKDNPHFFGLGKKKALSRKHCTIYYRDREGGHAEWDDKEKTTIYKDAKRIKKEYGSNSKKQPKPNPHLVPENSDENENQDGLPPNGFFVIECLGKNRILVDQTRVEQGESMVLRSGSAIRISSYMFYFLLPTDAEPTPHKIEIPLTEEEKAAAAKKTKKKAPTKATKSAADKKTTAKKRPVPAVVPSAAKKPKKAGVNATTATLAELEVLTVEELLERMDDAVSRGLWDRKNQFIGATICYHAVRSAGKAPEIQEKVVNDGGVSRSDIMDWIEQSDKFGGWVQQMLTNMEPRSYQAAITKSLLKSGFARTSGAGRYIKWELPDDIPIKIKKKKATKGGAKPAPTPKPTETIKKESEADSGSEDDNENDNDSDQPPEETPSKEESGGEEEEEEEKESESANEDGGDDAGEGEGEDNDDSDDANEDEEDEDNPSESGPDDTNTSEGNIAESDSGEMDVTS